MHILCEPSLGLIISSILIEMLVKILVSMLLQILHKISVRIYTHNSYRLKYGFKDKVGF